MDIIKRLTTNNNNNHNVVSPSNNINTNTVTSPQLHSNEPQAHHHPHVDDDDDDNSPLDLQKLNQRLRRAEARAAEAEHKAGELNQALAQSRQEFQSYKASVETEQKLAKIDRDVDAKVMNLLSLPASGIESSNKISNNSSTNLHLGDTASLKFKIQVDKLRKALTEITIENSKLESFRQEVMASTANNSNNNNNHCATTPALLLLRVNEQDRSIKSLEEENKILQKRIDAEITAKGNIILQKNDEMNKLLKRSSDAKYVRDLESELDAYRKNMMNVQDSHHHHHNVNNNLGTEHKRDGQELLAGDNNNKNKSTNAKTTRTNSRGGFFGDDEDDDDLFGDADDNADDESDDTNDKNVIVSSTPEPSTSSQHHQTTDATKFSSSDHIIKNSSSPNIIAPTASSASTSNDLASHSNNINLNNNLNNMNNNNLTSLVSDLQYTIAEQERAMKALLEDARRSETQRAASTAALFDCKLQLDAARNDASKTRIQVLDLQEKLSAVSIELEAVSKKCDRYQREASDKGEQLRKAKVSELQMTTAAILNQQNNNNVKSSFTAAEQIALSSKNSSNVVNVPSLSNNTNNNNNNLSFAEFFHSLYYKRKIPLTRTTLMIVLVAVITLLLVVVSYWSTHDVFHEHEAHEKENGLLALRCDHYFKEHLQEMKKKYFAAVLQQQLTGTTMSKQLIEN